MVYVHNALWKHYSKCINLGGGMQTWRTLIFLKCVDSVLNYTHFENCRGNYPYNRGTQYAIFCTFNSGYFFFINNHKSKSLQYTNLWYMYTWSAKIEIPFWLPPVPHFYHFNNRILPLENPVKNYKFIH